MKNMMKKTLSVIIALAMILVPMSVFAAEGDPVAIPSYEYSIYSGDTVTVGAGETVVFEMNLEYNTGVYDFVVEGEGDFTVSVCTEGTTEAYAEGAPVAAVNGKVETTITGYESTQYYCAFIITNNSTESVDYTCTVSFPEGTQSNPKALTLAVGDSAQVTVPAGSQYYVAVTLPQMYVEYQLTITGNTGFGYSGGMGMPNWDTNGSYTTNVASYWGPASFAIINNTDSEQTYTLALADVPKPLGSQYNPDVLPMNTTTTNTLAGTDYWYTWTAEEAGTFTFTIENDLCVNGWTYIVEHGVDSYFYSTAWNEYEYATCEFDVAAGDVVNVCVSIPTYNSEYGSWDAYSYSYGDVVFTTAFTTESSSGDSGDVGGDNGDNGDSGDIGGDTGEDVNYAISGDVLVVGENVCVVDGGYQYTLYAFEPTETGKYTITSNDSLLGNLGGTWHYYQAPTADNVNSSTLVWECTSVGQSAIIAVMANTNIANITITREDLDTSDEVQWTVYDNTTTPVPFEYEGDTSELVPVDIENDIIDSAVLGEDGYYHLNSADGPILYANLNEVNLQSLAAIIGYGKLSAVYYDDETGAVVAKVDYTEAVTEYINCAYVDDTGALYYPLTADLIEMFQEVGATNEWYDGYTWVHDSADAWMFACYYVETVPGGSNEGNEGDNNTGNVADPEIPNTGAETLGVAIAMMATVAALGATAVVTKKSKRVK